MSYDLVAIRPEIAAFVKDVGSAELLPKHLRGKPADLQLIMMMGAELGFRMMESIRLIHVIDGKPTVSAEAMAGLVMSKPVCKYLQCTRSDDSVAEYETMRHGWPQAMKMSYTIQQAQQAGLTGKQNWKGHPAAMLRARCVSAIARAAYPDVTTGIYLADEVEDIEPVRVLEGVVIDVSDQSPAVVAPTAKERLARKPKDSATLDALTSALADFGVSVSTFTAWLRSHPITSGKDLPPVTEWDGARIGWAVRQLANGLGHEFRAFIVERDRADAAPVAPTEDDEMPE